MHITKASSNNVLLNYSIIEEFDIILHNFILKVFPGEISELNTATGIVVHYW